MRDERDERDERWEMRDEREGCEDLGDWEMILKNLGDEEKLVWIFLLLKRIEKW